MPDDDKEHLIVMLDKWIDACEEATRRFRELRDVVYGLGNEDAKVICEALLAIRQVYL